MRIQIACAAAIAAFAVPAAAQAATLSADKPCYVEGEPVALSGQGFTPTGTVTFAFDGVPAAQQPADANGNVFAGFTAPDLGNSLAQEYTVTGTDDANPANVGTTTVAVTKQTVSVSPENGSPRRVVRFKVRGLTPRRAVWVHYVYRGRERARQRLGTAKAPCGTLIKRARFFPQRRIQRGTWTVQFDGRKRYSRSTRPAISAQVTVFRVFR